MLQDIFSDICLGLAAVLVVLCTVGVVVMRDPAQKLHFVAPASMLSPFLVALAVLIKQGWFENTAMAWLALGFMIVGSPYLSHATIRAIRVHQSGDWRPQRSGSQGSERRSSPR
ncbi:MAG: monovalent cation/H(+) antiporter subunit G [Acidimicrobiales bacterium]